MNTVNRISTAGALLGLAIPLLACAGEPPALSHNPFSRPHLSEMLDTGSLAVNSDGSGPVPDLKATMVSGRRQLANIAGRIFRPGDEVTGYTLEEVFEDRAVFKRDGKVLIVFVRPHPVTDHE